MSDVAFHDFVANPTLSKYWALRSRVLSAPLYDPQALVLAELHARIELAHRGPQAGLERATRGAAPRSPAGSRSRAARSGRVAGEVMPWNDREVSPLDWKGPDWPGIAEWAERQREVYRLSPRYHYLVGQVHEAWKSPASAPVQAARQAFRACLEMLLEIGSGESTSPWTALYVTDMNDVMLALRQEVRSRETMQRGSRLLDVVTTVDDEQFWFDVTDMMRRSAAVPRQRSTSKV